MSELIKLDRLLPLLGALQRTMEADLLQQPEIKLALVTGVHQYLIEQSDQPDFSLEQSGLTAEQCRCAFNIRVGLRLLREVIDDPPAWERVCQNVECSRTVPDYSIAQLLIDEIGFVLCKIFGSLTRLPRSGVDLKFALGMLEYWSLHGIGETDPDEGGDMVLVAMQQLDEFLGQAHANRALRARIRLDWGNTLGAVDLVQYHCRRLGSCYEFSEPPDWRDGASDLPDPARLSPFDAPQKLRTCQVLPWLRRTFRDDCFRWARQNDYEIPDGVFRR